VRCFIYDIRLNINDRPLRLLGLSAFAGTAMLVAGVIDFKGLHCKLLKRLTGWPINKYLSSRGIRIQKGWTAAMDKRMTSLNELIVSV
jgi:hypothetical protein